tara:strand:+ start:17 stop:499 length:483 start_codon:yes stop_codon:yes gene_type:complete
MNSKQQKQYDTALDKMNLTDSQRDAFDHSVKKSLIDLDTYQDTDTFSLHGYKLNRVMDDIVLAQYVDLSEDGHSVIRNGIHIPLSQVKRTWRMARVILAGPKCKYTTPGDIVCFPDDKGIKVDNLSVTGFDSSIRDCLFLNEDRFFGICEEIEPDDSRTE